MGAKVLRIFRNIGDGPVLYLCDDDTEAESLAAIVSALLPDATVVHLPASDALPGDDSPPSPANVGYRVTGLRRLRQLSCDGEHVAIVVVTTGEAAARRYLPADAFDAEPPCIRVGDPIDPDDFHEKAIALGYFLDDRIDEPGEIAIRGEVIDLFPADAGGPVRIDLADGHIAAINHFDAVTQLRAEKCEAIEIGRAAEPGGDASATLLDHIAPGTVLLSPRAEKRRMRFAKLARRAAKDTGTSFDAVDDERWEATLETWRRENDADALDLDSIPRFAEAKVPARAATRFLKAECAEGRTVAIVAASAIYGSCAAA